MPAAVRFSIVIPVYREQGNINECLDRLRRLPGIRESEVIVVDGDGGSTLKAVEPDKSRPAAHPFKLIALVSPPGRGRQLNLGACAASGRYLIFLHVDTCLPTTGLPLVARTLESHQAGAFSLGVLDAGALFNTWLEYVNARKRLCFTPYGDQAIFMRRETWAAVGGFPDTPLMEDVVMTRRLKRGRFRVKMLRSRVLTSDRRWRSRGYLLNFLSNTAIYLLFRMGVSAARLAACYRPNSDKTSKFSTQPVVHMGEDKELVHEEIRGSTDHPGRHRGRDLLPDQVYPRR